MKLMQLNKILNYVLSGVIVVLAVLLFQSGCNKKRLIILQRLIN